LAVPAHNELKICLFNSPCYFPQKAANSRIATSQINLGKSRKFPHFIQQSNYLNQRGKYPEKAALQPVPV